MHHGCRSPYSPGVWKAWIEAMAAMEPFLHLADHGKDSALSIQIDDMLGAFWEGIASFILQPSAPLAEFAAIVCSLLEIGASRP